MEIFNRLFTDEMKQEMDLEYDPKKNNQGKDVTEESLECLKFGVPKVWSA